MAANLGAGNSAGPHAEEASRGARAWGKVAQQVADVSRIVAAADVMRGDHELGTAPGLVHAPVLHEVGEPRLGLILVAGVDAKDEVAEIRVEGTGLRSYGRETPWLFDRERRREAVAILRGIGEHLPPAVTRVARGRAEERARRRRIEVEERLRRADRESGELDERPVRVEARARDRWAVVVHADLQIAAQGPVLGLLAAVEPGIGAGPHQEVAPVEPVLLAGNAGKHQVGAARAGVIEVLTTNVSADLEADIGARDVVEPVAIKAADLHVLHRRCLDWYVGGLRPSDRNESRGRPEEKTFHHPHLNPHICRRKWPFSIKFTKNLLYGKFTLVRGDRQRQRGIFESSALQFSGGCCRNNTSLKPVGEKKRWRRDRSPPALTSFWLWPAVRRSFNRSA